MRTESLTTIWASAQRVGRLDIKSAYEDSYMQDLLTSWI